MTTTTLQLLNSETLQYTIPPPVPLLAANKTFTVEVMMWLGIIVALAVLLAVVAMALRKKLLTRDQAPPMGFTLSDLRQMHAEGQLSDDELAQAEARTLTRSRSHYLGDAESDEPQAGNPAESADGSETDAAGAENPADDPDKNLGDGSAG